MAKKKTTKRTTKSKVHGIGRPKGSKNLVLDKIEILDSTNFYRGSDAPGKRRLVLATTNEQFAPHLEKLATMIEKSDRKLMSLLAPKQTKKKATSKA